MFEAIELLPGTLGSGLAFLSAGANDLGVSDSFAPAKIVVGGLTQSRALSRLSKQPD